MGAIEMDCYELGGAFRLLCYGKKEDVKDIKHMLSHKFAEEGVPSTETKKFFNKMDNFYVGLDKKNIIVDELLNTYIPCIINKNGKKIIGFAVKEEAEKYINMDYVSAKDAEISNRVLDFPVISLKDIGEIKTIPLKDNIAYGKHRDNPCKSSDRENIGEEGLDLYKLPILMGINSKKRRNYIEQMPENKNNIDEIIEEINIREKFKRMKTV